MLDRAVVDVQQLNTSDWSSSDAESLMPVDKAGRYLLLTGGSVLENQEKNKSAKGSLEK